MFGDRVHGFGSTSRIGLGAMAKPYDSTSTVAIGRSATTTWKSVPSHLLASGQKKVNITFSPVERVAVSRSA